MTSKLTALASEPVAPTTDRAALDATLSGHLPGLDGVRGVAILLVLLHRFAVFSESSLVSRALNRAFDLGWVGVQLFFVLSGFLITGILLDTKSSPNYLSSFFGRRVLRIFPLYYATLLVALVLVPLLSGEPSQAGRSPLLWLFFSNWGKPDSEFPHFWSLAVEEQFYFAWPFVVRALGARRLLHFCVALVGIAFASRVAALAFGLDPEHVYVWTVFRMDALAGGAIVAVLLRSPELFARIERVWRPLLVGTVVLSLGVFVLSKGAPRTAATTQTIGYSTLVLAFSLLVAAVVRAEARGRGILRWMFASVPLRTLGKYSYGMYVFHAPLHHFMTTRWPAFAGTSDGLGLARGLSYGVFATLLTLALAFASYQLFERRFLALKSHFVARRA